MNLSDSQKKIASNVIWSLGGKIVNMASALFVGILVACHELCHQLCRHFHRIRHIRLGQYRNKGAVPTERQERYHIGNMFQSQNLICPSCLFRDCILLIHLQDRPVHVPDDPCIRSDIVHRYREYPTELFHFHRPEQVYRKIGNIPHLHRGRD